MTTLNVMLWLAVVGNLVCMAWNVTRGMAYRRALEATAKERAELLVKVNAALAMPRPPMPTLQAASPVAGLPGWRLQPPDGQATMSGTTIRARGDSLG
jgi:hypothetical protein